MNDMSNLSNAVVSQSLAGRRLENKSVILTGAAGSIGRYEACTCLAPSTWLNRVSWCVYTVCHVVCSS